MTTPKRNEDDAGEAALDETLAATFPASDPLSSDPNPGHPDERARNSEDEKAPRDGTRRNEGHDSRR
jgi:hypothetical protein